MLFPRIVKLGAHSAFRVDRVNPRRQQQQTTQAPPAEVNRALKHSKSGTNPSNPAAVYCIQFDVTGSGLIKRVLVTLVAAGLFTFLGATSHASPIRPDLKKLLSQPIEQMPQYVPARAGWNGPEISTARLAPNPTFESLSPAASARELRATLFATMMPDLRILALLALVILLLRRIRKHERKPIASAVGAAAATTTLPVQTAAEPAIEVQQERPAA